MAYYKATPRLISFKVHCEKKGMRLLNDDLQFIDRMLDKIDSAHFKPVLERYVEKWCDTLTQYENVQQAMNLARRTANLWLMECADSMKR